MKEASNLMQNQANSADAKSRSADKQRYILNKLWNSI
jgi:hypothetical protein